jgi:Dolichyl-phosphate-mannose-protein mannosyltransferase
MLNIRLLLIVFFVALGLRLGYLLLIRGGPLGNADSPAYEDLGQKLLNYQSYMTSQAGGLGVFPTDLERPPGYPFFLSLIDRLIGPSRQHTAAIQCLLNALLAVALAVFVTFVTNKSAGFMAGLFYATDWVTIIHVPLTIAEAWFAVLLGLALCLYALALTLATKKASLAAGAGICLGFAALVKPIGQVIVLAFLLGWAAQEKRRVAVLLFLISYGACVGPWMLRNYRQYGLFTLSEVGTVDLYFYTGQASVQGYSIADLRNSTLTEEVNRISGEWMRRRLTPSERKLAMRRETWLLV